MVIGAGGLCVVVVGVENGVCRCVACSLPQVWKADWAGTEVAVKELLSMREHAHGRAAQRHQARRAQEAATPEPPGDGEDEGGDSDADR
jgi:hypothetical protein